MFLPIGLLWLRPVISFAGLTNYTSNVMHLLMTCAYTLQTDHPEQTPSQVAGKSVTQPGTSEPKIFRVDVCMTLSVDSMNRTEFPTSTASALSTWPFHS